MKKKKGYVIWLMFFALSLVILLYITWLFYKNEISVLMYLMNAITIIDVVIAILDFRKRFILPYINDHRQEYDLKKFVDRDNEIENVIQKINSGNRIIYVSGRLGIGKTHFLHKIIDIIYHTKKILISSSICPLYIELKQGENIKETIKNAINIKEDLNNLDLLKAIHKGTKSKTVIILLDNANKRLYLEIEEFIKTLIDLDNNIFFVITADSLEQMYKPIEMSSFTEKEVYEIATKENICIDEHICKTIIKNSGGLPSIIRLLIKQVKLTGDLSDASEIELYIEKICDNLTAEQQNVLETIAFYSLENKTMSAYMLAKYNNFFTERNLSKLADNGLISYNPKNGLISIESFFSQIVRDICKEDQFQICGLLYSMTEERNRDNKYKLVFLLLSDLDYLTENELIENLTSCICKKEYNFLIYLFELLDDFHMLNKKYDSKNIRTKLLYCYTHSLLEIGEYSKAYNYIFFSETWKENVYFRSMDSHLEFDFNYDLADMEHFFGNFESAINSYLSLIKFGTTDTQLIKCQWSIGHCYRHLGDINSMSIATACFEEIIKKKKEYYIRSYQSLVLIKLFFNDTSYDYEKAFSEMIDFLISNNSERVDEIKTSRQYALYYRVILNDNEKALDILLSALKNLEISGIRIKYDYYFEVAETLRHKLIKHYDSQTFSECLSYYNKALAFAKRSEDISLKCVTQLGIILCNILVQNNNSTDLNTIIDICEFCQRKKMSYIYNYAYIIKEYLINNFYTNNKNSDSERKKLMNLNLFIM